MFKNRLLQIVFLFQVYIRLFMISKILYSPAFVENYQWIKTFTVNVSYGQVIVVGRECLQLLTLPMTHREEMKLVSIGRI